MLLFTTPENKLLVKIF